MLRLPFRKDVQQNSGPTTASNFCSFGRYRGNARVAAVAYEVSRSCEGPTGFHSASSRKPPLARPQTTLINRGPYSKVARLYNRHTLLDTALPAEL